MPVLYSRIDASVWEPFARRQELRHVLNVHGEAAES
jgi:hypothetical protein